MCGDCAARTQFAGACDAIPITILSVPKSQIILAAALDGSMYTCMSRRPATVTQADIARVLRAARREGATKIEIYLGETRVVVWLRSSADDQAELETHEAPVL
jgi:hypothetical protein